MRIALALLASLALLSGCYDTEQRVLQRGQDVGIAAGTWQCRNTGDKDGGSVVLSGPNQSSPGDHVYRAIVDNSGYALRMEKSGDLVIVEADESGGRINHVFLRREADGAYAMLVPDNRPMLEALAKTHGVALAFDRLGPPKPRGTPEKLLAFLRAHKGPELKQTSTCRKAG
ncbi:MAG: hypothetical protein KF889_12395 [Alphaproteobacteria bacterium]|nr:hypothetical protein [Alphaproteobacteria bacterium]MCW5739208.1 hypothetical protein [Alphaproteobacteria bacterium]